MEGHSQPMPMLRLAYVALFLIALLSVLTLWAQVGGQSHLDLVPWYLKLVLSMGAAFATVRGAAAAVAGERGWNTQSVKWLGLALATLILCGMASYYAHVNFEDPGEETGSGDAKISWFEAKTGMPIRV